MARRKRRKIKKGKIKIAVLAVVLLLLVAAAAATAVYTYKYSDVNEYICDVTLDAGSEFPDVSDFLLEEYENAEYSGNPEEDIDMDIPGDYEIIIKIAFKEYSAVLHVEDNEAPVISGVEDKYAELGGTIVYKEGVTVTDNCDDDVTLEVDNSEVDLESVGEYTVTYTATDASGNSSSVTAVVYVSEPEIETYDDITEAYVNYLADQLLAEILTDDMTQYEQAYTIYWWVHENIAYTGTSDKTSWEIGAYEGLVKRQGDCYTYFATSKVLLTQAGITNMDIYKVTSSGEHYWNLIDLGDGWYHFDATRRADGTTFFYWTDEELMAYSDAHNGSHAYVAEDFPDIQ